MRSRRALLYMPGDDRRKIEKATTLGVDCICMDLEDGTALNKKAEARGVIAQAMRELDFGKSERCIRINSVGSGFEKDDLTAALAAGPDTIVLPKVESAEQVKWVSGEIESYELSNGLPVGGIRLLAGLETAKGVLNLKEIAGADKRLEALIFGGEDFAASIGATRSSEATELLYARQAVVTACAAHEIQAIDIVYIDFRDTEGLRREAQQGADWGFVGKQIIHPNQVESGAGSLHARGRGHRLRAPRGRDLRSQPAGRQRRVCPGWQDDRHAAGQVRTECARAGQGGGQIAPGRNG